MRPLHSWAFSSIGQSIIPGEVGVKITEAIVFPWGRNWALVASLSTTQTHYLGHWNLKIKHIWAVKKRLEAWDFQILTSYLYVSSLWSGKEHIYIFKTCLKPIGKNLILVAMRTTTTKKPCYLILDDLVPYERIFPRILHKIRKNFLIIWANEKLSKPDFFSWLEIVM